MDEIQELYNTLQATLNTLDLLGENTFTLSRIHPSYSGVVGKSFRLHKRNTDTAWGLAEVIPPVAD